MPASACSPGLGGVVRAGPDATYAGSVQQLVVGFDLDMTLVDSREGIVATARAALAEHGVTVTEDDLWPTIGIPIDQVFTQYLEGAGRVAQAVRRYRQLYPTLGVPGITALPGAAEAFTAVRAQRGLVVVVSAKTSAAVRLVLEHVGLTADVAVGGLFAEDKARALVEQGVSVYVGDHPGDVAGAHAAAAVAVAVATGPHDVSALRAAGADVVLDSLAPLPLWLEGHVVAARLADLDHRLRGLGSVLVAFSGGADSAFLLAAAARALGPERVVAATAVSSSLAVGELDAAAAFARDLGVRHLTPTTDELSRVGYRTNAGDRCFFCKAALLDALRPLADSLGLAAVLTGTNADDAVAGFRPGIRAAAERGALAPLVDSGFTKAQVRAVSRRWGLATWDKPAAACLSSRVAYGVPITARTLVRVDRAERSVREWLSRNQITVTDLRVRDLGDGRARIELDAACLAALDRLPGDADHDVAREAAGDVTSDAHGNATRDADGVSDVRGGTGSGSRAAGVVAAVVAAGFHAARLDPRGFRSGSMNDLLEAPDRYR
ncbi:MAG: ATP-dependent sacrificial sulfur transferase LarE [Angustibacter sp.]